MRPILAAVALCLFPAVGGAQDLGLDLTQPEPPPPEEKKEDAPPEQPMPTPGDPAPPTSATSTPPPSAEAAKEVPVEGMLGERDITQEDRVKSVQRKVYLKKYRFELEPYVAASINDPYFPKYAASLRGAYYLADTVSVAGRFTFYGLRAADDERIARQAFQAVPRYSIPQWSAMGDLEWSPLYGKVAIFNSILHFDAFMLGGLGVMNAETSSALGLHVAADLGFGMRFVVKDYLAITGSIVNTTYVDQPNGNTKGVTQNVMMLGIGVSLFVPFRSTGRESE